MAVLAGFTVNAGLLRSLVSAWLTVQDEVCWQFTRKDLHGRAMGIGRAHAVEFSLFPLDYRSERDSVWVRAPGGELAKVARTFKLKEEVKVEVRDDNKFYVGAFKVGDVIPEEEVFEDFRMPRLKIRVDARLRVVTADFRRIVKRAEEEKTRDYIVASVYEHVGIRVKAPEATIIFFNEKHSRIDLKGYEPWVVRIEGDAKSVYSLPLFSSLVVLGLTDILDISFQEKSVMEFSYPGSDFWLTFWLAPKVGGGIQERFEELLVWRPPIRKELWILRGDDIKLLEKTVRAVSAICRGETFNVGMLHDLVFYWKEYDKGYFHVSRGRFWMWEPPAERLSGVFSISALAGWLKDVEDLTCFLEGEPPEALVFFGKGPKIAPKQLRSIELVKEIEVPEVRGIEVFSGPTAIFRDVIAEAEAAEQAFLLFISRPFEIEVLGKDAVFYRATLPVDAFKMIEEDYVPVNEGYFRGLNGFFTSFPAPYATIGRGPYDYSYNVYLRAESTLGELRALIMQADMEVEDAIKAYKEFIKPPPPPPEVKLPPPVPPPPPPPIERVEVRILKDVPAIVGVDMKTYGPYKVGEIAWLPKENADVFVRQGIATYELVPPPPPPPVVVPPVFPRRLTEEEIKSLWQEMKTPEIENFYEDFRVWMETPMFDSLEAARREAKDAIEHIKMVAVPPPPPVKRPLRDFPEQIAGLRDRLEREMHTQFIREGLTEEDWMANRGTVLDIIRESIDLYKNEEKERAEPKIVERVDRLVGDLIKKIKVRPPPPEVIPPVLVPPAVEIVPVRRAEPLQVEEVKGIEEILGMPYSEAIDKFQRAIAENRTEEIAKWRELFKRATEETRALYKAKGKRWIGES